VPAADGRATTLLDGTTVTSAYRDRRGGATRTVDGRGRRCLPVGISPPADDRAGAGLDGAAVDGLTHRDCGSGTRGAVDGGRRYRFPVVVVSPAYDRTRARLNRAAGLGTRGDPRRGAVGAIHGRRGRRGSGVNPTTGVVRAPADHGLAAGLDRAAVEPAGCYRRGDTGGAVHGGRWRRLPGLYARASPPHHAPSPHPALP